MTEVLLAQRKAAVLAPSQLACLSKQPTVNLTAGCAHECLYCYARNYSQNPGKGRITLYANTLEKMRAELPRKRKRPRAVYFSPSCDAGGFLRLNRTVTDFGILWLRNFAIFMVLFLTRPQGRGIYV